MVDYRTPVYIQLKESIKKKIELEEYKPGMQIPSERELANLYGINRMTAKHAINSLVEDGYLVRMHGSGTYVSKDPLGKGKVEAGEESLSGLASTIRFIGKSSIDKVIRLRVCDDEKIKEIFSNGEEKFYELERIRYADEETVCLQFAYLPFHEFMDMDRIDFSKVSLYDYMEMKGTMPIKFSKKLTAVKVSGKIASYLELEKDSYVFLMEYFGYSVKNQLVEYTKSYFRPDNTRFSFTCKY